MDDSIALAHDIEKAFDVSVDPAEVNSLILEFRKQDLEDLDLNEKGS
jgi:hypothetical protein